MPRLSLAAGFVFGPPGNQGRNAWGSSNQVRTQGVPHWSPTFCRACVEKNSKARRIVSTREYVVCDQLHSCSNVLRWNGLWLLCYLASPSINLHLVHSCC